MLFGCGTVIATDRERSLIKLVSEPCDGCPGTCRRFGGKDIEIWLDNSLRIGTRVEIETSPAALLLGTSVTLGLPLALSLSVAVLFQSWLAAGIVFAASIGVAIAWCRGNAFSRMLRPRIKSLG